MRKRVLVVEDNHELLELLTLNLEAEGFAIHTAADGKQALTQADRVQPDAVVLDLMLPGMDGLAVCEKLRESRRTSKVPILILTGLASQLGRIVALGTGATDYLAKPASTQHIVERLRELMAQSVRPRVNSRTRPASRTRSRPRSRAGSSTGPAGRSARRSTGGAKRRSKVRADR